MFATVRFETRLVVRNCLLKDNRNTLSSSGRVISMDLSYMPCINIVHKYGQCYESYVDEEIRSGRLE